MSTPQFAIQKFYRNDHCFLSSFERRFPHSLYPPWRTKNPKIMDSQQDNNLTGSSSNIKRQRMDHSSLYTQDLYQDVWVQIHSHITSPLDLRNCKLVCKWWKLWMERLYDHSYSQYLPLVSNCERS